MTSPIDRARQDLARLDEAIRRAEDTIARTQVERDEIKAFIRLFERYSSDSSSPSDGRRAPRTSRQSIQVGDILEADIEAHRRPLQIAAAQELLQKEGIEIGGTHPRQRLSQMLSRDKRFRALGKRGWWLERLPQPQDSETTDRLFESAESEGVQTSSLQPPEGNENPSVWEDDDGDLEPAGGAREASAA